MTERLLLDVPYCVQINESACGAAALRMVFKYLRPRVQFSQVKMWGKKGHAEPHGSGAWRLSTADLVAEAKDLGFQSRWGRVDPALKQCIEQIRTALGVAKIPLIAVQKFNDQTPQLGHFRVIIGLDDATVVLHDPHPKSGGASLRWPIDRMMEHWLPTGDNVTGGVAIWIADKETDVGLGPASPNAWRSTPAA